MATVWMRAKLIKLKAQQAEERLQRRMMEACYTGRPIAPDRAPAFKPAETPASRKARDARCYTWTPRVTHAERLRETVSRDMGPRLLRRDASGRLCAVA